MKTRYTNPRTGADLVTPVRARARPRRSHPNSVPMHFGRSTRFTLKPRFQSPDTTAAARSFHELKSRLLAPVLGEEPDASLRRRLRLAANEAAALAWTTPFPLLTLPVLLEEKAAEVRLYAARQEQVRQTAPVLELAS